MVSQMNSSERILQEYDEKLVLNEELGVNIEQLIWIISKETSVNINSITHRVKSRNSLLEKVERKQKYKKLADITDIVAFRVITYFQPLVFSNSKDPLRINLEKIIELRNTSTHFITDEYELVYMPLFQACVLNYSDKIMDFFNIDINEKVSQNFLTLSANYKQIDDSSIRAKYSPEVAKHLLSLKDEVNVVLENEDSPSFAITINHEYFITKKKDEAEATIAVDNNSKDGTVKILKVVQDPNNVYKYSAKKSIKLINQMLHKHGNQDYPINMWVFTKLVTKYQMKANEDYTFTFSAGEESGNMYKYSYKAIQFLAGAIESDSELIKNLHKK